MGSFPEKYNCLPLSMLSSRLHLPVPWQIRQINGINVDGKGQINLDSCTKHIHKTIFAFICTVGGFDTVHSNFFLLTIRQRCQEY